MKNLLTSLATKASGSALSTDAGGRIFLDGDVPEGAEFPYVVVQIVSDVPEKTFTEDYENVLVQFSLFSIAAGVTEIAQMYADLKTLYDECTLSITGSTLVWMKRQNFVTMVDDMTTPAGTAQLKHWAVDYEVMTSLN